MKIKLLNTGPKSEEQIEACLTPGDGDGLCGGEDTVICDMICEIPCIFDLCGYGNPPIMY
ncbi:hypothetical protein BG95_08605 [Thermosipho sp. 1063]|uniref:hypothetical protein n=1 Tax=unclassified Thermosipho (in: thermotogales) TaxID=2676525 RepID=UPI0009492FA7|nr:MULTISPECIES: hypothetical protein [unclassified Thermosipho (in: thermotogales)]ANQ54678.1 hypothetical protein Y592_08705 [Thermosipho sp. 1070]APT72895.1 hypothetical protein BG95_08605 [Thermosipho sp. 1063]OOC42333.1 hypothetical protein XO08_08665 [Thermosipho sp. 1074]